MFPLELVVGWTSASEYVALGEFGDRVADVGRGVGPAQRGVGRLATTPAWPGGPPARRGVGRLETSLAGPGDLPVGRALPGRPQPRVARGGAGRAAMAVAVAMA